MSFYRRARRLAGRVARAIPWVRRQRMISCDYTVISEQQARSARTSGWFFPVTARRQQNAYEPLMAEMRAGRPRIDLRVAAEAVNALAMMDMSLLEIGCGGGYYSEVFATLPRARINYTGLDYSAAMIARAQNAYPRRKFFQGDATRLQFPDRAFDLVFNGVSLMHIPDYERAISESARVARHACVFHSVPVVARQPTAYLSKYAYGGKVVEVVFNRQSLLQSFAKSGLVFQQSWHSIPYDVSDVLGENSWSETFLCLRP